MKTKVILMAFLITVCIMSGVTFVVGLYIGFKDLDPQEPLETWVRPLFIITLMLMGCSFALFGCLLDAEGQKE